MNQVARSPECPADPFDRRFGDVFTVVTNAIRRFPYANGALDVMHNPSRRSPDEGVWPNSCGGYCVPVLRIPHPACLMCPGYDPDSDGVARLNFD